MSGSSSKKINYEENSTDGILKFHNVKSPAHAIDTEKIKIKIEELKNSIQKMEEEIAGKSQENSQQSEEEKQVEKVKTAGPKRINKLSSEHYFRAVNHLDLFNIGSHYSQEYKMGHKNFALYADTPNVDSHETLLGLTSYFNYHENINVTLVVDTLSNSFLTSHLKIIREEKRFIHNSLYFYKVLIADGVEIIEYENIRKSCKELGREGFDMFLDEIVNQSELAFWVLPHLNVIDAEREFFFPLMRTVDSTTLLVREGKTKGIEIKKFINHSEKYNLKINGVIIAKKLFPKK